jgi:hypothetical protein
MPALAHVILSLSLCGGAPAQGSSLHVQLEDRVARVYVDRTVLVQPQRREYALEFEAPPGVFRLSAATTEPRCSAVRFLYFVPGSSRHVAMTLLDRPSAAPHPIYLFAGTVPQSNAPWAHPTPVLFDQSAQCDEPAGKPLQLHALTENEPGSYYVTLFSEPNVPAASQSVTLDLQAPAGIHHYVYVPMPFPIPPPSDGWPVSFRLDISQALVEPLDERTASWMVCGLFRISSSK